MTNWLVGPKKSGPSKLQQSMAVNLNGKHPPKSLFAELLHHSALPSIKAGARPISQPDAQGRKAVM
jgi:hypothetical protein